MHEEVRQFIEKVRRARPNYFRGTRVLEVGSYNINGTAREFFDASKYVGCDVRPGPGVDVVQGGHELNYPDGSFDVVISTETLEHTPHWREVLDNMWRMLRSGGLMLVTAAAFRRRPHRVENNYYRNIQAEDIRPNLQGILFYEDDYNDNDIRFACIKP
jgi:SAM-dependent methyltransferase